MVHYDISAALEVSIRAPVRGRLKAGEKAVTDAMFQSAPP